MEPWVDFPCSTQPPTKSYWIHSQTTTQCRRGGGGDGIERPTHSICLGKPRGRHGRCCRGLTHPLPKHDPITKQSSNPSRPHWGGGGGRSSNAIACPTACIRSEWSLECALLFTGLAFGPRDFAQPQDGAPAPTVFIVNTSSPHGDAVRISSQRRCVPPEGSGRPAPPPRWQQPVWAAWLRVGMQMGSG